MKAKIMQEQSPDLMAVAELIKLAAETARLFAGLARDGCADKINDALDRIEAAADDLIDAGREMGEETGTLS